MDIDIRINGKKAHALMLKHRLKREAVRYGRKIDHWFVSGGHWPNDAELAE